MEDDDADGVPDDQDEEIDLENMDEEDLKSFIESVIADMVATGELEGGEGMESEESEGHETNEKDDDIVSRIMNKFYAEGGEIASALNPPSGCHFHPRCPLKADICVAEYPPFGEVSPGHRAACHFRDRVG